jgi:uncharacterized membrane protein
MKHSNLFFLSFLFLAFLAACNKEDDAVSVDRTPPTVRDVTLNDQSENIVVQPGTTMHFDAVFEDDERLGQFKIDIHNAFDDHTHGRLAQTPFEVSQTYDLIGRTQTVHEDITIPEDATPGPYHFTLQFFDAAGNEGEVVVMDFEIADPENQPVITITSHNIEEEIEVEPGESILLEGTVFDPDGLAEVHIVLGHEEEEHGHDHRRNEEEPLFEYELELNGENTWNFEAMGPIEIPEDAEEGHYELRIMAEDVHGHVKVVTIEVHIEHHEE